MQGSAVHSAPRTIADGDRNARRIPSWTYITLCLILAAYVALCTGRRDNIGQTDAWEHQRDIRALALNIHETRNPTYATSEGTPRYSPYIVFWGAVCHYSGLDSYNALSIAAVVNTLLLEAGLFLLLASFGEGACATAVLVVMVSLYGAAPGYSGTYALADLPWHEVNPSSFTLALTLMLWAAFVRLMTGSEKKILLGAAVVVLGAIILLSHALIGGFAVAGMMLIAVMLPSRSRLGSLVLAGALTAAMVAICIPWPWYSFIKILTIKPDPTSTDWFNPWISRTAIFQWDAPAMVCSLVALSVVRKTIVRIFLLAGWLFLALSLLGLALRSAMLCRLPVVAVLCLHIPIGVYVHEARILDFSTWPGRIKSLFSIPQLQNIGILQTVVAATVLYFLIPQLLTIAVSPYLARAYLAPMVHGVNRQHPLRPVYAKLLAPIHEGDVVLSDPETSWPVPSFGGRVVFALHNELFVPNQSLRRHDAESFFTNVSDQQRLQIVAKYHVQWIVVNREQVDPATYAVIVQPGAIVSRAGDMVLLNANTWRSITEAHPHAPKQIGSLKSRSSTISHAQISNRNKSIRARYA